MFEHPIVLVEGALLALLGVFIYFTVKNGVPWAWTKIKSWWTSSEARLVKIEADIAALKTKVGL